MPNIIQLRRSATASAVPTTTQLALGELAINTYDGKLYLKKNVSGTESIVEVTNQQNLGTTASPTFDQVITTNNGNGTNVKIGDDAWLGDANSANTIRIMGQQDATKGYISFGNADATTLGRSGSGALMWGTNTIYHSGNLPAGSTPTKITGMSLATTAADDLVYGQMADNDYFRIRIGGTATNAGWAEIATADDGTEPIYVRQYSGVFTTALRTATLLDAAGDTSFPGSVTAGVDLVSNFSSGDEGGQIRLNKAATNTTLTTGVSIDVYQNKLRIYETGGTNRGVYVDLTAAASSVGTNLLSGGGGASISVSDTAPASPVNGSLWWNSTIGVLKIYYSDGTSSQWVDASYNPGNIITQPSYPQNVQSGDYTLALSDMGKHIYSQNTGTQTITIPTNASVAFPIGTTMRVINNGVGNISIAFTGLTVYQTGRTNVMASGQALPPKGYMDLTKVGTNTWWIDASSIVNPLQVASYLIVAGGGGGGGQEGGGGGAGGVLSGTFQMDPGTTYSFTVGSGGAGAVGQGSNGTNSSAFSVTATGGGAGGGGGGAAATNGGSGGGAGGYSNPTAYGLGIASQGSNGGVGNANPNYGGGGGGGAGGVGQAAGTTGFDYGGNGGIGIQSSITGTATYYAGGGGGGIYSSGTGGTGGLGGGANGGNGGSGTFAPSGTANTGGGGGGGGNIGGFQSGGTGGSGVVIISIPTAGYTGLTTGSPTVTTNGSYTILKFTSSGSYTA